MLACFTRIHNSCVVLASFKRSTLGVRHASRIPSLLNGYSTRYSRSLVFLQL